eukprot:132039_1
MYWNTTTTAMPLPCASTEFYTKGPKGPKAPKGPKGSQYIPVDHSDLLQWKQSLAIISILMITMLIMMAILQTQIYKQCWTTFQKTQFKATSGKTLFILLIIGIIMSCSNSIVFTYFIFNLDTLSDDAKSYFLIVSFISYQIGRLSTALFFILRLHFIFKVSALQTNKCIITISIILSIIAAMLGCIAGITGPSHLIFHNPHSKTVNPQLVIVYSSMGLSVIVNILVNIIVMIYYIQKLMQVVIMQSEIHVSALQNSFSEKSKVSVSVNAKFVRTITKSTLLSSIGIAATFWLHLEQLVMAINGRSNAVLFIAESCFDGAVNVICMYLVFSFAKQYYDITCKWCHIGMYKCCTRVSKKVVLKKRSREVMV